VLLALSFSRSAGGENLPHVVLAMKFEFIIDLKAAKQIGHTIPWYELLAWAKPQKSSGEAKGVRLLR
jgi:hypothetical protein